MAQLLSRRCLAVTAVVASLTLAAAAAAPSVAGASTRTRNSKPDGTLVRLESSKKYGEILVDASGRTLYLLTADTASSLACTGGCTGLWPPLYTKGKPRAGKGLAEKELGTVKRGSSLQVTYDGHPLYLYAGDGSAGQVNGEGIESFGGTWYVLSEKGSAVTAALTSAKRGSSGSGSSGGGW